MKMLFVLFLCTVFCLSFPLSAGAILEEEDNVIAYGDSITAAGAWFAEAEETFGIKIRTALAMLKLR